MKSILPSFFALSFLFFTVLGCSSSPPSQPSLPSPSALEAEARLKFANGISKDYPYRVSFSAQGKDREILDINILEEVSPSAAYSTIDFIVDDDLTQKASALKFTQIRIKGGRKSFGEPDTVNKTINLR